jgi:hypothetical protein
MAKTEEIKKEEIKENWVTYDKIGKSEVTAVKVINGIKMYLIK